jgi:arsenate reductase (glutaredoxin)
MQKTLPATAAQCICMITLYGIPNCDTVKKSRAWFEAKGLAVAFHDFKKLGVPEANLRHWVEQLGWETVLNRKGTTWRKLDESTRLTITDATSAVALMMQQPSCIKRPVVEWDGQLTAGFAPEDWGQHP